MRTSGIWARGLGCANPTSSMRYEVCVCVRASLENRKNKEKGEKTGFGELREKLESTEVLEKRANRSYRVDFCCFLN